jgi:phosphonatase-like hydrolase
MWRRACYAPAAASRHDIVFRARKGAVTVLPELVVSDFAGTTMKEEGTVLVAYRAALERYDIPFTEADLAARRGASKRAVFQELAGRTFPPERSQSIATDALALFEEALRGEYETGPVKEIEGAGAAVARLRDAGVKVALTSGFERGVVDLLVRRLGWADQFDRVYASDDAPAGRPAPYLIYRAMIDLGVYDVGRVAVVGDTPLDLQAAANARAGWIVGVLSGAHGIQTMGATPHTHLLASIADLPGLLGLG